MRTFEISTHFGGNKNLATVSENGSAIYEAEYSTWKGVDGRTAKKFGDKKAIDTEALDSIFAWGDELAAHRFVHEREVVELDRERKGKNGL